MRTQLINSACVIVCGHHRVLVTICSLIVVCAVRASVSPSAVDFASDSSIPCDRESAPTGTFKKFVWTPLESDRGRSLIAAQAGRLRVAKNAAWRRASTCILSRGPPLQYTSYGPLITPWMAPRGQFALTRAHGGGMAECACNFHRRDETTGFLTSDCYSRVRF